MIFSSIPFLFYFLPAVLLVYFLAPKAIKNGVLFLFSLIFYAWGEPRYIVLMLISITFGYLFGLWIESAQNKGKHRLSQIVLGLSVIFHIGLLGYFKYADFFLENINYIPSIDLPLPNIALPVGISFYTFQILSYIIDVYRKEVKAQRNYITLAAYVSLFPQLIAGPIVRYATIEEELRNRSHSFAKVAYGSKRFILGLSKKVLIANLLAEFVSAFTNSSNTSFVFYWAYGIATALQIYFDFSGYSDMAIGLGYIFGFHFLENFDYPFISSSITEFWRRWHMSLGSWFKDYVYIPLGGNRKGRRKWIRNIFIVWFLTGFWHGAAWNFIIWGLYFGILLMVEKLFLLEHLKKHPVLSHVYVIILLILSFVIFDASSFHTIKEHLYGMFAVGRLPLITEETIYYLRSYGGVFLLSFVAATPFFKKVANQLSTSKLGQKCFPILELIFYLSLFLLVIAFLVDGSFNPFLYFRF